MHVTYAMLDACDTVRFCG